MALKKPIKSAAAAKLLGLNSETLGSHARRGAFTAEKQGKIWFFEESEILKAKKLRDNGLTPFGASKWLKSKGVSIHPSNLLIHFTKHEPENIYKAKKGGRSFINKDALEKYRIEALERRRVSKMPLKPVEKFRMKDYLKMPLEKRIEFHVRKPVSKWFAELTTPQRVQKNYNVKEAAEIVEVYPDKIHSYARRGQLDYERDLQGKKVSFQGVRQLLKQKHSRIISSDAVKILDSQLKPLGVRLGRSTIERILDREKLLHRETLEHKWISALDLQKVISRETEFYSRRIPLEEAARRLGYTKRSAETVVGKKFPAETRYNRTWVPREFVERFEFEKRNYFDTKETFFWLKKNGLIGGKSIFESIYGFLERRGIPVLEGMLGEKIVPRSALESYKKSRLSEGARKRTLLESVGITENHPRFGEMMGHGIETIRERVNAFQGKGVTDLSKTKSDMVAKFSKRRLDEIASRSKREAAKAAEKEKFRGAMELAEDKQKIAAIKGDAKTISRENETYLVVLSARGSSAALSKLAEVYSAVIGWLTSNYYSGHFSTSQRREACVRGLWKACQDSSNDSNFRAYAIMKMKAELKKQYFEESRRPGHFTYGEELPKKDFFSNE
ncbi:MAG: hypothetical protein WC602_04525 [archaeon]